MDDHVVTDCQRCSDLVASRSQIVNGTGNPDAELLLVGEAPGETEDQHGKPFVGRSGDVLTQSLSQHGIKREDIRITNCVRCRPEGNRNPKTSELENCFQHLLTEIEVVSPDVIMTLGKVPTEQLLDQSISVTSAAGTIRDTRLNGEMYRVLINIHPAATLYDPSQQEIFNQTIKKASELVSSSEGQTRLGEY